MRNVATGFYAAAFAAVLVTGSAAPAAAQIARPQLALSADAVETAVDLVQWRRRYYPRGAAVGAAIVGGAILGGAIAASRPYYYGPYYGPYPYYAPRPVYVAPPPVYDPAIAYCIRRFKSYDPVSQTYLGYDGYRHPCP